MAPHRRWNDSCRTRISYVAIALTAEDNRGLTTLIRRTIKPAFGSTQVRKVRGSLTEHTGTLDAISPSHCSRSPHGAGEGVSSARGLFRSW